MLTLLLFILCFFFFFLGMNFDSFGEYTLCML